MLGIEGSERGDHVVLVGFDNIHRGLSLDLNHAFAPEYQKNLGTFTFANYRGGQTKAGNHDFSIERPVMEHLAKERGVKLVFAQDVW